MMAKFLASVLLLAGAAAGQMSTQLAGGLKADIVMMGRNGGYLTMAVKITNTGKEDAFVLLMGLPSAFSDAGERFSIVADVSGVAYCPGPQTNPPTFRLCAGIPQVDQRYFFPFQGYTGIEPGKSVLAHFQLNGGGAQGEHISLTQAIVYRFADSDKDAGMTDQQRLKALRFGTLSFGTTVKEVVSSAIKFDQVK